MDGIKCILLDIEGTILPTSFVKETLFPYALNALPEVLAAKWDDPAFEQYRNAFPEEHRKSLADFQAHVEDLTKRDVKIAYLKNLQGYLWQEGYESGAYSTNLFNDVVPELRQWKTEGLSLAIYSSGSVFAQKLLFGHVQKTETAASASAGSKRGRLSADVAEDQASDETAEPPGKMEVVEVSEQAADFKRKEGANEQRFKTEDLTALFDGWFDTTNAGLKTEAPSYARIAEALTVGCDCLVGAPGLKADVLQWRPEEILFLSDNVKEIDAAHEAKLKAILVDRPGNVELAFADRSRLQIVESLSELYVNQGPGTETGKE